MKSIRNVLLLVAGLTAAALTAAAHGEEFKPAFVSSLTPAYLDVQTALAADDLGATKAAAQTLLATAKKGPAFEDFTDPVQTIIDAADIKAARAGFKEASGELITLIEHFGTANDRDLYVAHCPMAFSGKGGDWLQGDQQIANPYYGAGVTQSDVSDE
jgi:Cu(I)/Ag(I) efflux system membrane fusion protein